MGNVPEVLLLYRKHASQISTKSSSKQQNRSEEIQKNTGHLWQPLSVLRQESAQEVLSLIGLHVRPEMDVVDATLGMLLQQEPSRSQKSSDG